MRMREGCGTAALGCLFVLVAILVFAALAGALVYTGEVPLYAPRLTGFAPDPNHAFLPTTPITLTFDQPMNPASVEAAFSLMPSVPGDFRWNETHTLATFVPTEGGYELGTSYTVRFAPGAEAGTIRRTTLNPIKWGFSLPSLVDEQPLALGTADLGPQPVLQASFYYDLDCEATLQTFSITPDAAGELDCGDRTIVFTPTEPLDPGTAYVAELAQVFLASDDWPQSGLTWEFETAPPLTVTDVSPAAGESLSNLWTPVRISFSRPVVADSILKRFTLTSEDGSPVNGQATWQDNGATFTFQPTRSLIPDTGYRFTLQLGVQDEMGFELADSLARAFETEEMLTGFIPIDGARSVQLDGEVRIDFAWPMDQPSVEAGLSFEPVLEGAATWKENTLVFRPQGGFAPETSYLATVSADVRDADGAVLAEPQSWSFHTQPFILKAFPKPEPVVMQLQQPVEYTFALPMDSRSVQSALAISPPTSVRAEWSNDDRTVSFQPDPAWESGIDYEITLSASARTADGAQALGKDHTLTFSTGSAEVQFGDGPNVQVMNAGGERAFQFVFRGADVVDFALYLITPTQFLNLYSSGFRGIGPQESQIIDTATLTPTVAWREAVTPLGDRGYDNWQPAEARIPVKASKGLYILTTTSPLLTEEAQANGQLLVALTDHILVLKQALAGEGSRSQAEIVAWDTTFGDGTAVVSATVRLYDRDGTFLAEGLTDADGLLTLDTPGDPGPLMALSDLDGDVSVCGLGNEWSESGWWWWWAAPPSRPLFTIYSYTDRPIYRPAQTIYFKDWLRADDDMSYTVPSADLPVIVRLRDARDNVAATQVLSPTQFGTIHGEFALADEPMLGTWNLETEVEGTVTRQPLKVEEYRKPEYEVVVQTGQKVYVHGEIISLTVDAAYYFGQPVSGADVVLNVYPTYPEDYFYGEEGSRFGYPIFGDEGRTDAQGQWTVLVDTDNVFHKGSRSRHAMLALEATVTDDSGQSVSSYQTVVVRRTSQGLTLLLERHGYQPDEEIAFSAQVRDRHGEPVAGVELTAQVLGWDEQQVASSEATTDDRGEAHFSVRIMEQSWYSILVRGVDTLKGTGDGGREMTASEWVWVYDPTGRAPWYRGQWGQEQTLSVSADRSTYEVGDVAQLVIFAPNPGPALMTFERGKTREAQPIPLVSGTNLITVPIRADFAPNIYVSVNQFGPLGEGWWFEQSQPERELGKASTQIYVPMHDRLLTVTLTVDSEAYHPGDEATFQVQVVDHQDRPVMAEVSLAVVDEAIYALAEDMSRNPFEVFYAPRPNVVRTFDSLRPARWLYPEAPGLGGGDGDGEGGAPRKDFLDTAHWAPTVVTDENGQATITFTLPDNLTEWRALARAVTTDTLVGQTTTHVVVSQDIVVRPVLPRFLIAGDAMTLTAVVHNFTTRAVSATVELELEGIRESGNQEPALSGVEGSGEQVVHVPAGGSAVVGWPVVAEEPGQAQVTVAATAAFGARLIGEDAVQLPLPVRPLAVPEMATFAGTLTPERPTDTITITLPADAIEGMSRLEVNLAPSVAPGLLDGIEYLIDYPFG